MSPAQVGIIYSKAVVDIQEALGRLDTLEGKMKRLEGRPIKIDSRMAVRGLESLSKAFKAPTDAYNNLIDGLDRMGDRLTSLGMNLASFGYRMMLATSPLAAAGLASLKMATDLETSMALVATQLLDQGLPDIEEFVSEATRYFVDLSTQIPIVAKDMGDAMYYLVSSMTIDPGLAEKLVEPISKAAVAGGATAQLVAEAVTPILNVYKELGDSVPDVSYVLDVLFKTVQKGKGEFADLAVQVGDFIIYAEQAGATFEEAMAAYAMATRVTTPAQAATWIANLYRSLTTAKGREALHDIGIETSEIVAGTGQWATETVALTDAQEELAGTLQNKLVRAQENVLEATTDVQWRVDNLKSSWGDFMGNIEHWRATGELIYPMKPSDIDLWQGYRNALDKVTQIQGELAETTQHAGETYQVWTGEKALRPSLDIMQDIGAAIGKIRDEEKVLGLLEPIFPRIRSMKGAILFLENLEEIVAWEEEFRESTGLTQEAFEIMMATFESKIGLLKNMFLALGFDLIAEYADDLKRLIDGLTDLFGAFRELPADVKSKVAMISGLLLLAGPAALVGSVLMMGGGMLISLIASLASLPSLTILTGLGILLGDKLPILLGALGSYGGGAEGFVRALADLVVHFGLLSEADAIGVLQALGISVDAPSVKGTKFLLKNLQDMEALDGEKIAGIAQSIEDIAASVSRGVDDLVEWKDAFGLFLEDVEKREGAVGTLVRYLERLWDIIKEVAGFVAPKLGLPEAPYEEWGAEEKAGVFDRAMGFLIGTKLASFIFGGLASGLQTLITVGVLLKIFGVVGTGAAATATSGGVVAVAGGAIGTALGLAITGAVGVGLAGLDLKVREYVEKRFPGAGPYYEDIMGGAFPWLQDIQGMPEGIQAFREQLGQWFGEDFFGETRWEAIKRIAGEGWRATWDFLFDYPDEETISEYWANLVAPWKERGALGFLRAGQATHPDEVGPPEEYDAMIRALMTGEGVEEAIAIAESHLAAHLNALLPEMRDTARDPYPGEPWRNVAAVRGFEAVLEALGPAIVTPFEQADKDIQVILNRWGGKFDDIARDREPSIKPIFHDEEKLNKWLKDFRWLEGRHESIWHITEYIQRRYEGEPTHLGGYPMHEGGYPSLNLPNLLASEFVMSPRTTQVLENYLGRLDQQKVRSAVTHAPVGMTINFFKGSVSSKDDAEQAADIIFDRIADRAGGLSLTEI